MKSILHWGATVSILVGTVLGASTVPGLQALALTQAEVEQQLRGIPVFTITDLEGNPYVAIVPNQAENENGESVQTNTIITEVFISAQDAEASLGEFQEQNPEFGADAQVTPVSLGLIYTTAVEAQAEDENLQFRFVPIIEELQYAASLFPEGAQISPGVPLFLVSSSAEDSATEAEGGDDGNAITTLLTIEAGEDEIIPLFFTQEQVNAAIAAIDQEDNASFVENLQVDVIWLGDYISRLESTEAQEIQQYRMVPMPASLQFVNEFRDSITSESGNSSSAPAAPAPAE